MTTKDQQSFRTAAMYLFVFAIGSWLAANHYNNLASAPLPTDSLSNCMYLHICSEFTSRTSDQHWIFVWGVTALLSGLGAFSLFVGSFKKERTSKTVSE